MAKKTKVHRRFIRIGGKLEASPPFTRKSDADQWYDQQKRLKQAARGGILILTEEVTFLDYSIEFINKRLHTHCYSTFVSDEQRLRDYLLPELSELPINKITTQKMRKTLEKITSGGLSPLTRDRVKALASSIFKAALNEDPPLVTSNPVSGIQFEGRRQGKKKIVYFPHVQEVEKFLANAEKLGPQVLSAVLFALTSGLRKSEIIGLKWKDVDFENHEISVNKRIMQANLTEVAGTKGGEDSTRIVPAATILLKALRAWRKASEFKADDDYIFAMTTSNKKGRFINPRTLYDWQKRCLEGLPRNVTTHGLRHTYGREFVKRGGSLKRLQAILGHSSLATTSLYSDLADERHQEVANLVTFNVKGGAKRQKG